jgi:hypothetical protein
LLGLPGSFCTLVYENRAADAGDDALAESRRVIVRIARSWLLLFKLMKSGRAQVQLAASYINHMRINDGECFGRFLQECVSPLAVAAIIKSIISGGLKSDSLAEEVGIAVLLRTLSGLAAQHAEQLFPRGAAAKVIKKLAGNLKSGRAIGSDRSWNLSLDILHCFADFSFFLEALNKFIYIPAVKGAATSKKGSAKIVLELFCSARYRRHSLPPLPLSTLILYAQVPCDCMHLLCCICDYMHHFIYCAVYVIACIILFTVLYVALH